MTCRSYKQSEWPRVLKRSRYPGLIESTCRFDIIVRQEAERLMKMLYHAIPLKDKPPTLQYGRQGWAKPNQNLIQLFYPDSYCLSAHTILHEYTHIITQPDYINGRRQSHGTSFIDNFNLVLCVWRDTIREPFTNDVRLMRKYSTQPEQPKQLEI